MTARILDPAFRYLGAATHADPLEFRRRMRARVAAAKATAHEAQAKVRALPRTKVAK